MKNLKFYKIDKEESYWKIRDFLRNVFRLTEDKTLNWTVARLDYDRWHMFKNCYEIDLLDHIYICEKDHEIIAAFIADCKHGFHLQIHPEFYTAGVFEYLFSELEKKYDNPFNQKEVHIAAPLDDPTFENTLSEYGYKPKNWIEYRREMNLANPLSSADLRSGLQIRSLGNESELPARSWASWRAYHPNEPDENYDGWSWYNNIQLCPLYRRDLDLVCIDSKERISGFVTMWFDDYNRIGYIDPVGVVPEYWRQGIGRALVTEALIRVQKLGATKSYIDSFEEPAHRLYESAGLKVVKKLQTWSRNLEMTSNGGIL